MILAEPLGFIDNAIHPGTIPTVSSGTVDAIPTGGKAGIVPASTSAMSS